MKSNDTPSLLRVIKLPHATAMVAGTIIGASIFVQPSEVTGHVPSISIVFIVWAVSGLLTLFGALVSAELSSLFTPSGGVYVYMKEAYSPSVGFLWGWAMFWVMHSGIIAASAVILARYFDYFMGLGENWIKVYAVCVIFILSAINYIGVKQGSMLQTSITLGKILVIAFLIVFGFIAGSQVDDHFSVGTIEDVTISAEKFFFALVAGLFTFGGWHMVAYNSEETVNPRKTIPRSCTEH